MAKRNGTRVGDYRRHGRSQPRSWKGIKHLWDFPGFGIIRDKRGNCYSTYTAFGVTVWLRNISTGYSGRVEYSDREDETFEIEGKDPEEAETAIKAWIADKLFYSNTEEETPSLGIDWLIKPLQGVI